jgi:SAM-dependent methyltransferase
VDWHDADRILWPDVHKSGTDPSTAGPNASRKRLRAYAVYCGLLWQYASGRDVLGCLGVPEPELGHPMPISLDRKKISQDIAMASLDLNNMAKCIPLRSKRRVLEIGAGYGRLAYLFRTLFPDVQYSIVDISPTLAISQNYLAETFGENDVARFDQASPASRPFNFFLPHQLEAVPDRHFDLAINVSSFDEMPPEVSNAYLSTIGRVCRGHLFLSGYAHHGGDRTGQGLNDLSYNPAWKMIYNERHEIFPGWIEKVFEIP